MFNVLLRLGENNPVISIVSIVCAVGVKEPPKTPPGSLTVAICSTTSLSRSVVLDSTVLPAELKSSRGWLALFLVLSVEYDACAYMHASLCVYVHLCVCV